MLKESIDKLIEAQKHVIDSYISGNTDDLFKAMRLMIESTQKIGATRAQWEAMAGLCLPENKERYARCSDTIQRFRWYRRRGSVQLRIQCSRCAYRTFWGR